MEPFHWGACQSTSRVNVPLTATAKLSAAGWGSVTEDSRAAAPPRRERGGRKREEREESGGEKGDLHTSF